MTQLSVMAAVPVYTGQVVVPFVQSYIPTWGLLANKGVRMELEVAAHFSLVQYARNYLFAKFLQDTSYTHLLWIDSDLGWDPRAALRMFERGKDVICGVYPVKMNGGYFPYQQDGDVQPDGLQLADKVPTGFMFMSRKSIEDLAASVRWYEMEYNGEKIQCPNVFDLIHEGKQFWGEDFVLCKRLKNLGYQIWVETDMQFSHVGMNAWHGNLSEAMRKVPVADAEPIVSENLQNAIKALA